MNSIAGWILAALFFLTTVLFGLLWFLARRAVKSEGLSKTNPETSLDGDDVERTLVVFSADKEYQLLSCSAVSLDGKTRSHGLIRELTAEGGAQTFLVPHDMSHLQAGDVFKLHNNEPYKVSKRSPVTQPVSKISQPHEEPTAARPNVSHGTPVSAPAPAADDQRTVMISMTANTANPLDTHPFFKVVEGPDTGAEFALQYAENKIGRGDTNGVALTDDGASRNHCKLTWAAPAFLLEDLGSTNGTLCNDSKIDNKVLEFGDRIKVSDTVLVFTCKGYELAEQDADRAIAAFQETLDEQPEFLPALKNLAFLLERDVGRSAEAEPLWKRISALEKGA